MDVERVALVGCDGYADTTVEESVARAFDLLGGVESVISPGQSVFVKVNAVMAVTPETNIVTNPKVIGAVIGQLKRVTDAVAVGDSPGGPFNRTLLKRVYEKTGVADIARETGAELALDTGTIEISLPEGKAIKRVMLCRKMIEADHLVSVSKFKTHRYLNVTGPVKNLYGCVPGLTKFVYHSRYEDPREFADLVVDVHLASGASFHVVDAVEVIDGDGSRRGDIKKMDAIAAGRNAFALEALLVRLAGLETTDSRVLSAAVERGLCPPGVERPTILGEKAERFVMSGFRLPERTTFGERIPASVTGRLSRAFNATPMPLAGKCTACGTCARVCPRGAIALKGGLASVDTSRCIRCFCCSELCEFQAIGLKKPLLARLARRPSS